MKRDALLEPGFNTAAAVRYVASPLMTHHAMGPRYRTETLRWWLRTEGIRDVEALLTPQGPLVLQLEVPAGEASGQVTPPPLAPKGEI